jgi:hypothetical protein
MPFALLALKINEARLTPFTSPNDANLQHTPSIAFKFQILSTSRLSKRHRTPGLHFIRWKTRPKIVATHMPVSRWAVHGGVISRGM